MTGMVGKARLPKMGSRALPWLGERDLEKLTGKIPKWTKALIASKLLTIKNRDIYFRKGQIDVVE